MIGPRITRNKPVTELSINEGVLYNNVYAKNKWAYYYNGETEVSCIDFIRNMYRKLKLEPGDDFFEDDDFLDEYMLDLLQYTAMDIDTTEKSLEIEILLANLYMHLGTKCTLRESLLVYEDFWEDMKQELENYVNICNQMLAPNTIPDFNNEKLVISRHKIFSKLLRAARYTFKDGQYLIEKQAEKQRSASLEESRDLIDLKLAVSTKGLSNLNEEERKTFLQLADKVGAQLY